MSGRRRSVMLDEEHAELLRAIAERYGVPMSSYLRGLLEAAWEAESRGLNAAMVLRRGLAYEFFTRLGVAPLPLGLLSCSSPEDALREGERLGASIVGLLGEDLGNLIANLAERLGVGIAEYQRLILIPPSSHEKRVAAMFLLGLAKGGGLKVEEREGGVVLISW